MALFSFHANRKPRNRKPLITVPAHWAAYDPVFETMDRFENDYHRFARRTAEHRQRNDIR